MTSDPKNLLNFDHEAKIDRKCNGATSLQVAIMRKESIPTAMKYIKLQYELEVKIGGPESVDAKRVAAYMADPSRHMAYLTGR